MALPPEIVTILQDQEDRIDALLAETVTDFETVVRRDVSAVSDYAKIRLATFAVQLHELIEEANINLAATSLEPELNKVRVFFEKVAMAEKTDPLLAKLVEEAQGYVDGIPDLLEARKLGGVPVSTNIKRVRDGSTKVVRAIVDQGIKEGKGSFEIARDIEQYIRPTDADLKVKPYDYLRQKFPTIKASELEEVPKGSVSYNAFLIARTEGAHTYRMAVADVQDGKPWAEGLKWNLSGSHPATDICDRWAHDDNGMGRGVYTAATLPKGHPNCFCYVTTVLIAIAAFRNYLKTGEMPSKPTFTGDTMTFERFRELSAK